MWGPKRSYSSQSLSSDSDILINMIPQLPLLTLTVLFPQDKGTKRFSSLEYLEY